MSIIILKFDIYKKQNKFKISLYSMAFNSLGSYGFYRIYCMCVLKFKKNTEFSL